MADIRKAYPNLNPDSRYVVRVRAINAFNVPSEWSDSLVFTTLKDNTTPNPPTNLQITWDVTDLRVDWTPPTTNTDDSPLTDLRGYQVTFVSNSITKIYNVTDPFITYSGALNASDFGTLEPIISIAVRAYDFTGNLSEPATIIATNDLPPDPIQAPILVPSFNGIMITLVPPPGLTDYKSFMLEFGAADSTGVFNNVFNPLAELSETDTYLHVVSPSIDYYYRFKIKDLFNQVSVNYSPVSNTSNPAREIPIFTLSGDLEATLPEDCAIWELENNGKIKEVSLSLNIAGSSFSEFVLFKNGSSVGSYDIGSGLTHALVPLSPEIDVVIGDRLSVQCSTAGGGAKSASIKVRIV